MVDLILLAVAGFFQVFLLVLNSQFARDQRVLLAYCMSWFIGLAQFAFIRYAANIPDQYSAFFAAGFGCSLGVATSIVFYKWLKPLIMKKGKDNGSK